MYFFLGVILPWFVFKIRKNDEISAEENKLFRWLIVGQGWSRVLKILYVSYLVLFNN